MARSQNPSAELACGAQKVAKFDRLVAFKARHRGLASNIALRKAVYHRLLEAALVVEHVVGNTDAFGDRARIVNIAARTTGAFTVGGCAMVVELQRDSNHVV